MCPAEWTPARFRADDGVLEAGAPDMDDGAAVLVVRPEHVRVGRGVLSAVCTGTRFAGTHVVVELELSGGQLLIAHLPVGTAPGAGERVAVSVPPERCVVLAVER